MYTKDYQYVNIHVSALLSASEDFNNSIKKGNSTLVLGRNGKSVSAITSICEMIYQHDFLPAKKDFDAGRLSLDAYLKIMNVIFALVNSSVNKDEDALHISEIRAENDRLKKLLAPKPEPPVETVAKAKASNQLTTAKKQSSNDIIDRAFAELDKICKSLATNGSYYRRGDK